MEDRLAAELDLGQDASLVGELEALTLEDPLRERPWALWMLALYRSGRQADALAAFRRAQSIFSEQLGIDPGRSLQQLHERILAQDPALLTTSQDAAPVLQKTEAAPALNIFLIADIRGYTTFTHVKGDEAAAALSTRFAALTKQVVGDAGGSLVELRGDEALVAFTSARQAIGAATDLQITVRRGDGQGPIIAARGRHRHRRGGGGGGSGRVPWRGAEPRGAALLGSRSGQDPLDPGGRASRPAGRWRDAARSWLGHIQGSDRACRRDRAPARGLGSRARPCVPAGAWSRGSAPDGPLGRSGGPESLQGAPSVRGIRRRSVLRPGGAHPGTHRPTSPRVASWPSSARAAAGSRPWSGRV